MTLIDGTSLDEPYADGNFAEGIAYLFIVRDAFSDDIVSWLVMGVFALLAVAFALPFALHRAKKMSDELHRELVTRTVSWSWLVAIIGGAIFLGRVATIAAVALLSLLHQLAGSGSRRFTFQLRASTASRDLPHHLVPVGQSHHTRARSRGPRADEGRLQYVRCNARGLAVFKDHFANQGVGDDFEVAAPHGGAQERV